MDIIRDDKTFPLTIPELREAAQEWDHLCRMQRIVKYLADYYDLPLSVNQMAESSEPNMQAFYNTYHLPFCVLVDSAYSCDPEKLVDCPDQVFLFLSTLAQSYEHDENMADLPEDEAFALMFQEKDAEAQFRETSSSKLINLGVFIQATENMAVGDPSVPKDEAYLCTLSDVEPGIWNSAVQEVFSTDQPSEQRVAFLLSKSNSCPYTYQQMLEQLFFWERMPNSVVTMHGAVGLFDLKYYQDPTSFGIPPLSSSACERWARSCIDMTLDFPYAGILPHGVVSSSGEGEGSYDVYYLRNAAGKVIAIAVDYLLYGEI